MPIKITTRGGATASAELVRKIQRITPRQIDRVVGDVAIETLRSIKEATPKRTGDLRRAWTLETPPAALGTRRIFLDDGSTAGTRASYNQVMTWLEYGTAEQGTGYIYPLTKKALFLPLTRTASLTGWHPGMKFGRDYILVKRVRGITPRYIVLTEKANAIARLRQSFVEFLRKALT